MVCFLNCQKISFNDIKSLNNKHGDGLPGQGVPGHDAGFEGKGGELLGFLLPRHEPLSFLFEGLPEGVGEQARPCQPLGPQGKDHQGVQEPARGHRGQGGLRDDEKIHEAVKDRRGSF